MSASLTGDRRSLLCLMGSTLAVVSLSLLFPVKAASRGLTRLPGSLALLPLHHDVFRHAKRHMATHTLDRHVYRAVQDYLFAPTSPSALDRFADHVRQDFAVGRVAVVDGWVLAETEVVLLGLAKHRL